MTQVPMVTVLTPTYNRAHTLPMLFESLEAQTSYDFEWLLIDDGSTDGTSELVEQWSQMSLPFPFRAIRKTNGGKHTALNIGFREAIGELTIIVDSDDYLTEDAINSISERYEQVISNSLAGVVFLKGYTPEESIGDSFREEQFIDNDNNVRIRQRIRGDKAEVFKSDILRKYSFPVFKNEKFIGEGYVWQQIAFDYNMLYVNKVIYISEYRDDGLTKAGRRLRITNPLGGMAVSEIGMSYKMPLTHRIKEALLYDTYGHFAKINNYVLISGTRQRALTTTLLLPSWLLYLYWREKYKLGKKKQ